MGLMEISLIGIALSMDAVAVALTNGMVYKGTRRDKVVAMPLLFGLFQGLMPLIGYFAGGMFADTLSRYAGVLVFLILGIIGGKMLKDAWHHEKEEAVCEANKKLTYKLLIIQAVATSIDAFAVGIGLSAMGVNIISAASMIAVITGVCCVVAIVCGKRFGCLVGNKSELLGGSILVFLAIKALF